MSPDQSPAPAAAEGIAGRSMPVEYMDDLQDSLARLGQLATGLLSLEESLRRVAQFAVRAIPGAEGAGLTLLEENRSDTIVATADFVIKSTTVQPRPGLHAVPPPIGGLASEMPGRVTNAGTVRITGRPPGRTQRGVPAAGHQRGRAGRDERLRSSEERVSSRCQAARGTFAAPAAIAVQNAQVLEQTKRLASQLQAALSTRAVIERAIGIMMSRSGGTETEALDRLHSLSQHQHEKLPVIAQTIVQEAVRRARARHINPIH